MKPPIAKTETGKAYKSILEGKSNDYLLKQNFSSEKIQKAIQFRDLYENRDVLISVIAKEIDVSQNVVKDMKRCQKYYEVID